VNKPNKLPEIRKEAFAKARETLGLSTQDLAGKACLSNRQIEQIENGETGSFYGAQIKYTAAKKVASILQLTEEQAFDFGAAPIVKAANLVEEAPSESNKQKSKPAPDKESAAKVEKTKAEKTKAEKVISTSAPAPVTKPQLAMELQDVVVEKNSSKTASSASGSNKKLILFLCLTAAVVFSVINLRPLFFPEQPKEELIVIQEAAPSESASASAPSVVEEKVSPPAPMVASTVTTDCPAAEPAPTTYKPDTPKKAGDMVYLQSKSAQMVCVIDALGKVQNKQLEPGVGVSVYGKAPLKVLTAGLDQVDLYYQGAKVRPSNPNGKTIVLESAELTQPLTPSDSQLR
jgi:cytoskeleton protein RodZ